MAHAQELAQECKLSVAQAANDGPVRSLWDPDGDEGESFVEGIFRTRLADVNQRLLEAQRQTAAAGPTPTLLKKPAYIALQVTSWIEMPTSDLHHRFMGCMAPT